MSSDTTPMHDLDLISLKNILETEGINSTLIQKSEDMPLASLIVQLNNNGEVPASHLNFSFIPLPEEAFQSIKLLQCYTEFPFEVSTSGQDAVLQLINELNIQLPIGGYGLRDGEVLYYRHIHSIPKFQVLTEQQDLLLDLVKLLVYSSRNNLDRITAMKQ